MSFLTLRLLALEIVAAALAVLHAAASALVAPEQRRRHPSRSSGAADARSPWSSCAMSAGRVVVGRELGNVPETPPRPNPHHRFNSVLCRVASGSATARLI